jgi:hypothetical protein
MSTSPAGYRQLSVAVLLALTTLALSTSTSGAVPIDGKYGLGLDTGDLLSTNAEGALLWGKSDRTAWLLLVDVNGSTESTDHLRDLTMPDTLITGSDDFDAFFVSMGPGLRKFVRADEHFSPYFDITLRGIRSVATQSSTNGDSRGARSSSWGVEGGLAIGAEYFFTKWPVSLAAHADLLTAGYSHRVQKYTAAGYRDTREQDDYTISGGLGPHLQVRVYF